MELLAPAAIFLLAGSIQGLLGFGAGLVGISLLALFWDLQLAVSVGAVFSLPMVCYVAWQTRSDLSVREVWPLALGCLLGIPLGVSMLVHVNPVYVKGVLGLVLVGHGGWTLCGPEGSQRGPVRRTWGVPAGFAAGILSGAFNASGPPVVIYGTERRWVRDEFRGNLSLFFLVTSLVTLFYFVRQDIVTADTLRWNAQLLVPLLVGVAYGDRQSRRVEPDRFRKVVLLGLLGTGCYYLLTTLWAIF
jgi:uncharacterized membrane protein YfcA